MTDPWMPSRSELLAALRASRDEVVRIIGALPPERLEEGRYENGWNGRQILAHLPSIEWSYPRLIELAREPSHPDAPPSAAADRESGLPTREMRGGNDAYNERQVSRRAHLSVADLIAEFGKNRAATIEAVETAPGELFSRPIRSAGGRTGPLATVFYEVAVLHVLGHARAIGDST